jgi:hypothetical protein
MVSPPSSGQHPLFRFCLIALLLGVIAAVAQEPQSSDKVIYQSIGQRVTVVDCADIHCFRILPAPLIEHLPGPSLVKWKAYAVVTNAAAAMALGALCLALGLTRRASEIATWIAAFGLGPLQSVFDPYTSDPVMYLLGPVLTVELLRHQMGRATLVGSLGVLSKEFAAAVLWIFSLASALQHRWETAARAAAAASTATLVWLAMQTLLLTVYNYTYGGNKSANLLTGSYFVVWLNALGWPRAVAYMLLAFGPLLVLMAAGFSRSPRVMRALALASLPAAVAFVYVQQPDRALWNFHFVVIPIAMLVLQELPNRLCWTFVAAFGAANLRLGENSPLALSWFRGVMLAVSVILAIIAVARARVRRDFDTATAGAS